MIKLIPVNLRRHFCFVDGEMNQLSLLNPRVGSWLLEMGSDCSICGYLGKFSYLNSRVLRFRTHFILLRREEVWIDS
jgi:hypothetical protein